MNLYFLLEGRRTEPRVYRDWIKYVFPHLTEVRSIAEVQQDHYLLVSGGGYPQYLKRLDEVLADIEQYRVIDHFLICVDAEEDPPETKLGEIEGRIAGRPSATICQPIIHDCCIETWFLGNKRMMKRQPQSPRLRQWKSFYDVSVNCPESMGAFPGYRTRALFHLDYLKEMLAERNQSYSKQHPGPVQKHHYLRALVDRHQRTNHIQSFGRLMSLWRSLGGNI